MKCVLSLVLVILLSPSVWALGRETGNGGQGIYCPASKKVEIFDYYEARTLRGVHIDLGSAKISYQDKVRLALKRLSAKDPVRAHLYTQRFEAFASETRFVKDAELESIPDADSIVIPKRCKLVQLAIQRKPEFPGESYYFIDQDFWKLMDNDSKAGLVLHEIIYREALTNGAKTSEGARYFNSILAADEISKMSLVEFYASMINVHLYKYGLLRNAKSGMVLFRSRINNGNHPTPAVLDADCQLEIPTARALLESEIAGFYPELGTAVAAWAGPRTSEASFEVVDATGASALFILREKDFAKSDAGSAAPICVWDPSRP